MTTRTTNTIASQSDVYELQDADGTVVQDADSTQVYYNGTPYNTNTERTQQ